MKLYKAYAKVNIFLKITGLREEYHEIISRFVLVNSLYDELSFTPKDKNEFEIIGNFSCATEQNTIYKAYEALLEFTKSTSLENLMKKYAIKVDKNIQGFPACAYQPYYVCPASLPKNTFMNWLLNQFILLFLIPLKNLQ